MCQKRMPQSVSKTVKLLVCVAVTGGQLGLRKLARIAVWKESLMHDICYISPHSLAVAKSQIFLILILFWYLGNMLDTKDSAHLGLHTMQNVTTQKSVLEYCNILNVKPVRTSN